MVNASAATESLLKHIKPLWVFPALILIACGVDPRLPGPVMREEVGNFQDLAQFDRVPQQVLDFHQVSNFDRSAYNGPLGIDSAMDTSDVVEELRGSRIDFVARYYRDPTSSLPALSSQEARTLASLGLKIVAVWEQNSPDPENLSYSSGDSDAFSANIFLVWRAARESHPTIAVALQWSVSQVRASELRCWMSAIGAPRTVALMLQLSAKRNLTLRSDTRAVRSFARARLWLSSQRL